MADEANLVLKVDASEVSKAGKTLDELADAGARAEKSSDKLATSARAAGSAVGLLVSASIAAVGGLALIARNAINAGDAMNDLHLKTGLAFADLATYDLMARQSGTSIEGVAQGFKFLSSYMTVHSDKLKEIGVTSKDANIAMQQFSDAISGIQDPALKTKLSMEVLGRSGTELLPMLSGGSAAFKLAQEQSAAYGQALERVAPKADQFNDAMARIEIGSKVMGMTLADRLLPTLNGLADAMLQASADSGFFEKWGDTGAVILRGMAIAGLNVLYVLRQIGDSIGGSAAQFAAILAGDFKSVGTIGREMESSAKAARSELDRMTDSISNAGKTTTTTSEQIRAHNRALEEAARRMLMAKQAADERQKSLESLVSGLEKEAATFGLTSEQIKLYDAALLGANQKQITRLATAYNAITALKEEAEAVKAATAAREEAARVLEKNKTASQNIRADLDPVYKATLAWEKYIELIKAGTLTAEEAGQHFVKMSVGNEIESQMKKAQAIRADIDPVYKAGQIWAEYVELVKGGYLTIEEAQKSYTKQFDKTTDEMAEFAKQAGRNIQDAFANFLFDPFKGGLSGMLNSFQMTLRKMAAEALASNILKSVGTWGSSGGGSGSFFGDIASSLFGGAKAEGGPVTSGMTYLVGERGPELFTPATSGNITPNDKLGTSNNSYTVINNFTVSQPTDRRTQEQIAAMAGASIQRAMARGA